MTNTKMFVQVYELHLFSSDICVLRLETIGKKKKERKKMKRS